jgi:hypothetical protein
MGTPDNPEEYVRFEADDVTIYVARALVEKLEAGATEQPFYLDGYGRYSLILDETWGRRGVSYKELRQQIESLQSQLTPAFVEEAVQALMRQGEDVGGGVNALRLARHLLGNPPLTDVEATWAYQRIRPALRSALEQVPSLYFFEGD